MGTEVITASGAKPGNLTAVAAAAGTGVHVGCAIVATRFVIDQTDPVILGLLRCLIGFCLLLFPAWRSARRCAPGWFKCRDLLPIASLGIGQFGILIGYERMTLLRSS